MENQEPPKREPQFSDENTPLPSDVVARFNALTKEECEDRLVAAGIYRNGLEDGFRVAWKGIESKIDDGTLMVGAKVKLILEHLLDDTLFMHGNAEVREEKIRHIAKTHGIELE